MTAELPTEGFIYGVRLRSEFDYRYVGLTTKSVEIRLKQHFKIARSGRKTPLYDWLRTHDLDDVIADELDSVKGIEELGQAEIDWIELLRRYGHPLLNLSQGVWVRWGSSGRPKCGRPQAFDRPVGKA